jgi:hypothetical protein
VASTWLPVRRASKPEHATSVTCPRKGPLPTEISLLVCSRMNEAAPERCAACSCKKAQAFAKQIDELKLASLYGALSSRYAEASPPPTTTPKSPPELQ